MPSGNSMAYFAVIDTGIGIPKERAEDIFKAFQLSDMSDTRKFSGLGLGLTICHLLTRLHDGEIGVDREEGLGSEFYFTLPFAQSLALNLD